MSKRGHHKKDLQEENRKQVFAYFKRYPFASQLDCARDLQISKTTVWRHVEVLRREMQAKKQENGAR